MTSAARGSAVAALSLNPFVLDLLSAARGYGPALAFSVSANLTFLFPNAALALLFASMLKVKRAPPKPVLLQFCLPGLVPAAAILAWPLRTADTRASMRA